MAPLAARRSQTENPGVARWFLLLAALFSSVATASVPRASAVWESNPPAAALLAVDGVTPLEPAHFHPTLELAAGEPAERLQLFEPGGTTLVEADEHASFHPLQGVELIDTESRRGPPVSYPETRVWVIEVLGTTFVGEASGLSVELRPACSAFSCGVVSGNGKDPLGLWSLQQRLGRAGERRAVELLKEEGWTVFWGGAGSHPVNSRGADVFAFNQKTQQLAFFDDKNTMFRKTVNKAKALVENFEKSQNVEAAMAAIEGSNLPETAKDELLLKLKNKDFKKFITAASGRSTVTAVGEDLEKAGVEFYDLKANAALRKAENKALVAAGEVAEQGGKTASKLGGALSVVGKGLVIAGAVSTVAHVASGDEPGEALVGIAVPIVGSLVPTRMVTTEEEMRGVYEYMYLPVLARQMAARDAQTTDLLAPSHSVTPAAVPSH